MIFKLFGFYKGFYLRSERSAANAGPLVSAKLTRLRARGSLSTQGISRCIFPFSLHTQAEVANE
jgi:hypothetical protein